MAPNKSPKRAPRMTARSVNSLRVSSFGTNGRNSPGGAVELHGRSLKEALPNTTKAQTKLAACRIMPHESGVGKQILTATGAGTNPGGQLGQFRQAPAH